MKPLFILLAALFSYTAQANDAGDLVRRSFAAQYADATDVQWATASKGILRAQFMIHGQYANAFYSPEGEFLALSRNISLPQLTLPLQSAIRSKYAGYWISDLFEMTTPEGTNFYITLRKGDAVVKLRNADASRWMQWQTAE